MKRLGARERALIGASVTIGATVAMAPAAHADEFTVTTLLDSPEAGSLRSAIDTANATPEADHILFQAGLSGTITLESDLPTIYYPVEIDGPGADQVTVDGDDGFKLIQTVGAIAGQRTSISGLTLANGSGDLGGAVMAYGTDLTLDGVRIEDSHATVVGGGVWVGLADLDMKNSEVTGNTAAKGGGIYAGLGFNSAATISGSEITGNAANQGGGIYSRLVDVTISDTEISGNEALTGDGDNGERTGGGGFFAGVQSTKVAIADSEFSGNSAGSGGAMVSVVETTIDSSLFADNSADTAAGISMGGLTGETHNSVTNSTFTGNESARIGGAIVAIAANLRLASSTITGNIVSNPTAPLAGAAGVIVGNGPSEITNSIVSGNTPSDLATFPVLPFPSLPAGTMSGSFDLIGDRTNADFTETVPGSNITSTAPQLGALADNGGPTRTMLPADTSPVVNKGSSDLIVDQRGLTRPSDFNSIPLSSAPGANGADIGAIELQGGPFPPPPDPPPNPTCETDPVLCPIAPPSNSFAFGKVKLNKKKGVATLQVKVPGAGKVQLVGSKTVKGLKKTAKKRSTIGLTVKVKGKAAKQLKKKGRAKVKASVRFTPAGGTARTKSKTVKLVKKKRKAGRS